MDNIEKGYWAIANQKHLIDFKEDANNREEYEATIIAGKTGSFLAQIKGHESLSYSKAVRLAKKAQIPELLLQALLPRLRKVTDGRIDYSVSNSGDILEIEEHIDTEATVFKSTGALYDVLGPTEIDQGSLETLSYAAVLPRSESEVKEMLISLGMHEEQAASCLAIQSDFEVVKRFEEYGLAEPIYFNEYIWRCNPSKIAHALSNFNPSNKQQLEVVMKECKGYQGQPVDMFSGQEEILNIADSVGLLDKVTIKTSDNVERDFIFTPHLRSEEQATEYSNDLMGDVKLFIASMGFGEIYSRISRLGGDNREKTINFLRKLLREGEAGDATAIGIDYIMLEDRGIVRVKPTKGQQHKMIGLKPEVIQLALKAIEASISSEKTSILPLSGSSTKTLAPGRYFTDVESGRMKRKPYALLPNESKEAINYHLKKIRGEI